jgi:hypothetical protein
VVDVTLVPEGVRRAVPEFTPTRVCSPSIRARSPRDKNDLSGQLPARKSSSGSGLTSLPSYLCRRYCLGTAEETELRPHSVLEDSANAKR